MLIEGVSLCGAGMFTLSGTPDFTPFWKFMISPIHYYRMCQSTDYVYG